MNLLNDNIDLSKNPAVQKIIVTIQVQVRVQKSIVQVSSVKS